MFTSEITVNITKKRYKLERFNYTNSVHCKGFTMGRKLYYR